MASHLTITSTAPAGVTSSKSFSGTGTSDEGSAGPLGLFGALLAGAAATKEQTGTTAGAGFSFDLGNLIRLTLGAGSGEETGDGTADPQALGTTVDGTAAPQTSVMPEPLVNFIDALTDLQTALEAGGEVDPDLLGKVEDALAGLAEALGLDLDALSPPEDISALLAQMNGDRPDLAAMLAALFTPIAQTIAPASGTGTEGDAAAVGATGERLSAIGEKMAALLSALETGDVAPEKLAALGVAPDQALDPEIEAALKRFAEAAGKTIAVPAEPELAAPSLKLSEPVLTGKAVETPVQAPAATPNNPSPDAASDTTDASTGSTAATRDQRTPETAGDTTNSGSEDSENAPRPQERSRLERQADGFAAPAATDASNTPAPSQNAAPGQTQAVRVDAAANPRLVQVGYQTSQQQLNLPQIAFEMARQVTDGNTRFQIRLDPPELGRIDVRLDIDSTGQVNARLTVEKAETLDLMQRDQRGLEKALQQAGVDTNKTNLEFSLKQNPFAGQQNQNWQGQEQGQPGRPAGSATGDEEVEPAPPLVTLYRGSLQASGVNIIA